MASITLKDIPEELHLQLKAKAAKHGRSLNQEILQDLRAAVAERRRPIEEELADVRALHARLSARGVWLTEDEINRSKREGRP